jgi:hypothetical protein
MVLLGFQGAVADQRSEVGAGPTITNKKRWIFGWLGSAPDERYVSARVGFSGIWSSLENSAYPN